MSEPKFYVDFLTSHGLHIRGRKVDSCHLLTDGSKFDLIEFGKCIGLRKEWLHMSNSRVPHFDLVVSKRLEAIELGAIELKDRKEFSTLYNKLKEAAK